VPVWHAKAQKLVDAGRLVIVGVVEEQHPDRCRLFLQWQRIKWPMMHDPINTLRLSAVPIITAIDEYGIVRFKRPDPASIERDFLDRSYPKPERMPDIGPATAPDRKALRARAEHAQTAAAWRDYADAAVLWDGAKGVEAAITAYRRALAIDPADGAAHFRLGVCYRLRYDSPRRQEGDFQRALDAWQAALDRDPNQYIWRRRIQQYGPRLEKPYPFYDWVAEARAALRSRGETPIPLVTEPTGAEIAQPIRAFVESAAPVEPDPQDRITRDAGRYIRVETVVAPAHLKPGATARVHLIFRVDAKHHAHWNNEAEPLRVWVRTPAGWGIDQRLIELPNPRGPATTELRQINFEIRVPANAPPGTTTLFAYALYNVCEDAAGQCLYRRQDISIPVHVAP
jgi:tetratricopeptide (TPR) repeat protein